ncbi:tRNA 2-thiouridine(34) synthase MnmA [Candidatus Peregrinibacteria bacterium]|nr:tRNA 2-thiouridine(34) synthase MnmA [Candidatus Peregrinibacteria bacterium]
MKIALLLSGGVDSAVALKILKDQGHDLTAFYLKIWLEDDVSFLGNCPWQQDLNYVRKTCEKLDVPLKIIPLQKEYFENVVKYTISEIKKGRTPNPDIMCNNHIKFGLFLKKINKSYEKIATGHYSQLEENKGIYYLKMTSDPIKDQTYFLSNLKQDQLKKIIFPIGHLTKKEVRKLAEKYDLPNKDRKDSQGICFLGKIKYKDFIKHYLGEKKGDILEFETHKKLGEHKGYWYYTIGQRKGIELGGGPYFVVKKDIPKNIIYVSKKYHTPEKKRNKLKVENFNWFANRFPNKRNLRVKLRHGEHIYKAKIDFLNNNKATINIDSDDQGIAPGQFAAFYDEERCLGSAVISES